VNEFKGYLIAGRYRIEKKLAEGGMGRIFLAKDNISKKKVVIKKLHVLNRNREFEKRFEHESEVLKRINHKNIITIYDYLSWKNDFYMVLEYLDGITLRDRLEQRDPMSMNEISNIFTQLLDGLETAHKKSIVHRDLKPSNIFLIAREGYPDKVKILDFGIAIFTDTDMNSRLTKTGDLIGTPMYLSPEQIVGKRNITAQSDIYALGIILYEMISGFPPFKGSNNVELLLNNLYKVQDEVNRSDLINDPLFLKYKDVVDGCLKKSVDDRFRSVNEIRDFINSKYKPVRSKKKSVEFLRSERQKRSFVKPASYDGTSGFTTFVNGIKGSRNKVTVKLENIRRNTMISVFENRKMPVDKSIVPLLTISNFDLMQVESPFAGDIKKLERPDIFILNGGNSENLKFIKLLKSELRISSVPVMVCGGETDLGFIASAINAGANDYISFPFTPEDILKKISVHKIE